MYAHLWKPVRGPRSSRLTGWRIALGPSPADKTVFPRRSGRWCTVSEKHPRRFRTPWMGIAIYYRDRLTWRCRIAGIPCRSPIADAPAFAVRKICIKEKEKKCLHSRSSIGIILFYIRINFIQYSANKNDCVLNQEYSSVKLFQSRWAMQIPLSTESLCISLIENKDLIGSVAPGLSEIIWKASSHLFLSGVADLLFSHEG